MRRQREPLVGREWELDRFRAHSRAAGRGEGGVVLVTGPAGIGKTRLVSEALERLRGTWWSLHGACTPMGAVGLLHEPWVEILRSIASTPDTASSLTGVSARSQELHALLPLNPVPAPTADTADSLPLAAAVSEVFEALARTRPTLVVLEDLHWADASSIEVFTRLAEQAGRRRLLVVATLRVEELPPEHLLHDAISALYPLAHVHRLDLSPLAREAVVALAADILGQPPGDDVVDGVMARAEGNPLFTVELLAHLAQGGGGELPRSVREVLLARTDQLPPATMAVVRAMAVAGREVAPGLIATVAGVGSDELGRLLLPAETAGLTRRAGPSVAFSHALVQEAIYSSMLPSQRRQLHDRLAALLAARPLNGTGRAGALSELAYHFDRAGRLADALCAYRDAAEAAVESLAHTEANRLLQRLLELWDQVPEAERMVGKPKGAFRQAAAVEAVMSGSGHTARALADSVLAAGAGDGDPVAQALAYQGLAWSLHATECDLQSALALAATSVEMISQASPGPEKAACLAMHAKMLLIGNRYDQATPAGEEALAMARAVGARAWECDSLTTVGFCRYRGGELDEARSMLHEAQRIAHEDTSAINGGYAAYMYEAEIMNRLGKHRQALDAAARGVELVRFHGGGAVELVMWWARGVGLARLGRWDELEALLDAPRSVEGILWADRVFAHLSSELHVRRGRYRAAQDLLDFVARPPSDPSSQVDVHPLRVELAMWQGDVPAARRAMALALDTASVHRCALLLPEACAHALRAESTAAGWIGPGGRGGDGLEVVHARETVSRLDDVWRRAVKVAWETHPWGLPPHLAGWASLCEGEVARLDGEDDLDPWRQAVSAFETGENPHHVALAYARLGEAMQRVGHPGADDALSQAHAHAVELGCPPLIAHVSGLRPQAVGRGGRAGKGGLTPREQEVLAHLLRGRTNPEIGDELGLSARTVGSHVSAILRKLGVESRTQLPAVAGEAGLAEG